MSIYRYFLLFFFLNISAQNSLSNENVFYVNGANAKPILKHFWYWIDPSNHSTISNCDSALKQNKFKLWKTTKSLYLGNNPNDLWIHFRVKNISKKEYRYWWSIYSQADTLYVYEKSIDKWHPCDTLYYSKNEADRKIKVRFLATELNFKSDPNKELLLQIKNKRHVTNLFSDITTPQDNLNWETIFFWKVGFFVGGLFLMFLSSIIVAVTSRRKTFYIYGIYLLMIFIITLQEELFISIFPKPIFYFLNRLNSLPLSLISVNLHLWIIIDVLKDFSSFKKLEIILIKFLKTNIALGLITSALYFIFMNTIGFHSVLFNVIWWILLSLTLSTILLNGLYIITTSLRKHIIWSLFGVLFIFFNPATYYLNYSGVITIYEISHPNYFYFIAYTEILILCGLVANTIKKTITRNYNLQLEKKEIEDTLFETIISNQETLNKAILETQEQLLNSISQDLHDDAGQQLTVINFQLENFKLDNPDCENSLSPISESVSRLSQSLRNISHSLNSNWFNENGLIKAIEIELNRIQNHKKIHVVLQINDVPKRKFRNEEKIVIFRIFQEVINNILKHSKATKIEINIETNPLFKATITDNGVGFTIGKRLENTRSIGLQNCVERAKIINYTFEMVSEINNGTTVILEENKN